MSPKSPPPKKPAPKAEGRRQKPEGKRHFQLTIPRGARVTGWSKLSDYIEG
jgi:hypothetical protein